MAQEETKVKMLYQVWKGNNVSQVFLDGHFLSMIFLFTEKFIFEGRLIFGPDVRFVFLMIMGIAGPAIAFCVNLSCMIRHKTEEHEDASSLYLILLIAAVLAILALTLLFLTSSTDPGIVPRGSSKPLDESLDIMNTSVKTPSVNTPKTKEAKYCYTCSIYRPPRASHCYICNNCVQRFDHHCDYLGQCIGLRNYRLFFFCISTTTIFFIYVFVCSWINLCRHMGGFGPRRVQQDVTSVVLIGYCFIGASVVGVLVIYHCYLICTNQTTSENLRETYKIEENPYNKGILKNIKEVMFQNIPPPFVDFRSIVDETEITTSMETNMSPNLHRRRC